MKLPAKPTEQPKALATLVSIVDLAITFRFPEKTPSLSRRGASGRSIVTRCPHICDLDERINVANALRDGD